MEEIKLNEYQEAVKKIVLNLKKSVICLGAGGTGKSELIKHLGDELKKQQISFHVTATTGSAANKIKGETIHRFSGAGYEREFSRMLINCKKKSFNWTNVKVLIIDEISMMAKDFFDNLDKCARIIRNNENELFGGIIVVLFGDFFQLPPCYRINGVYKKAEYLFKSLSFQSIEYIVNLGTVYRQNQNSFVDILHEIRVGYTSPKSIQLLKSRVNPNIEQFINTSVSQENNQILPTYLTSSNNESDVINTRYLALLKSQNYELTSVDYIVNQNPENSITTNIELSKILDDSTRIKTSIFLKKGAQVILMYNLNEKYHNGKRGIVTMLKSCVRNSLIKLLQQESTNEFQTQQALDYFDRKKKKKITIPVVKFLDNSERCIFPVEMNTLYNGNKIVRVHYPLRLGWSITVHKCQGLTLDSVYMSSKNTFMNGQFYVAISRVKDLESLTLVTFSVQMVKTSIEVLKYMKKTFGWNCSILMGPQTSKLAKNPKIVQLKRKKKREDEKKRQVKKTDDDDHEKTMKRKNPPVYTLPPKKRKY